MWGLLLFWCNKIYHCLNENKCPPDYKLINSTNKCILNCKDDNIFNSKYELMEDAI